MEVQINKGSIVRVRAGAGILRNTDIPHMHIVQPQWESNLQLLVASHWKSIPPTTGNVNVKLTGTEISTEYVYHFKTDNCEGEMSIDCGFGDVYVLTCNMNEAGDIYGCAILVNG